ncbi:HTH domain-containing protein [Clostridium malenominatum]|uniref:HTH domain-containing protein n=1 Tax=Clostridium malenominatum TaxID=1539 RepID=UPI003CD087B5
MLSKDIKKLEANPNVKHVSELAITYTDDFKKKFIEEYLSRKLPRQMFIQYEFDIDILGKKRIHQGSERWKKAYEKNGII